MSTTSDSAGAASAAMRPMPAWIKGAMLSGFIFFICWGGAIAYWRTTRSAPGGGELALYLLGLPSLLVLGLFAGRALAGRRAAYPAIPAASAASAAAAGKDAAAVAPASLAILATALRTPHGVSAGELAAAIADDKARADLDPELVGDDGLPVMSARSPDAGDDALRDEIADWLRHNGMVALHVGDEQWRALVLGTAVLEELAGQAASLLLSGDKAAPQLHLAPLLPSDWPAAHRQAAALWFDDVVVRSGWPRAHLTLLADAGHDAPALSPPALLARLAQDAAVTGARTTVLVLACASNIGDDTVARWSAAGSLFTSRQPQGLIPGEGAAALLLTDVAQASAIAGARFALLAPLQETRRDMSADDSRRMDATALGAAVDSALARHGTGDVAKIAADTGHRASRMLELLGCMAATMPQLDETTDVLRTGSACGSCGAVPFTAALALAAHEALASEVAVLCIGNEDPYLRSAAVVRAG